MNKEQTIFNLTQARDWINSMLANVESGDYDDFGDLAFSVDILTVLNYLNNSWHFRDISLEEFTNIPQPEYEKSSFSIPRLDSRLRLLDVGEDPFV